MWEDPIVAEVRRIREQLSERFDFDVKAIFADMRKRQKAHEDRLVVQRKHGGGEPAKVSDQRGGRASA